VKVDVNRRKVWMFFFKKKKEKEVIRKK